MTMVDSRSNRDVMTDDPHHFMTPRTLLAWLTREDDQ